MSAADLFDGFWGAVVGGVIGALGTGAAQIWSFRRGVKTSRAEQSRNAAAALLEVVHECDRALRTLPYTESPAGSPLSYGERLDNAQPMLDALGYAEFVTVPLLTEPELAARFSRFAKLSRHVASPRVDAQDIHSAVKDVRFYCEHVRDCLTAHLQDQPTPTEPVISLTAAADD
jgi:hypothetical protein